MKKRFFLSVLCCVITTVGYADDKKTLELFKREYDAQLLQVQNMSKQQQEKNRRLEAKLKELHKSFDEQLLSQQAEHQKHIRQLTQDLSVLKNEQQLTQQKLVQLTESVVVLDKNTTMKSEQLNQVVSYRTIGLTISLLVLLALMAISYWLLKKRQLENNKTLTTQVQQTLNTVRQSEEKMVQSDSVLAERLLDVVTQLKHAERNIKTAPVPQQPDHTLAIKLADEIHRMRKRLAALPQETKGLKPLTKSLERLEEELLEQGYEIVDYTGMKYSENMSVKAQLVPSDDLEEGQSIINKVITPQINFKGVLIRMADIEVSVG